MIQRWRQLRGDADDQGHHLFWRRGGLAAAGDLQVLVSHRRRIFPLRYSELRSQNGVVDLRRIPGFIV